MTNRISQFTPWANAQDDASEQSGGGRPFRAHRLRNSIRYALQGFIDAWRTQPNFRIHVYVSCAVIGVGIGCRLESLEWLWLCFAIGLVIFAELMNTAIEQTVDLVVGLRPDPLARRVKDMAAACVLAAAIIAVVIGVMTLGPYLFIRA